MPGSCLGYLYPSSHCKVDLKRVSQLTSEFWEIFLRGLSKVRKKGEGGVDSEDKSRTDDVLEGRIPPVDHPVI